MITFEKILIAVDNGLAADSAAKVGFELAKKFNAHVGLVHITEPVIGAPVMTDSTMGMPMQNANDITSVEIAEIQNEVSDNIIDHIKTKYGSDLRVSVFTEFGATADGIIKCGHDFGANIIVMGSHNRSGFERFFTGSVAEEVVRDAGIPVLVVPLRDEKAD
ncbi:universal stress protein [Mucilaginibacter ginkgonis]|uniref:Universal stress protein n=1 Tax=Mucilaginibacter ginkgonis TaxID=2682091 RepID=A0A6I4HZV6_9SPHI|nr:universal stress protein [Mucilaginibacter ginkgonis]QQL48755.1 universal stress protein [Mucilaginibacter ginkgonis]